ncbi:hypothetical protein WIW90_03770 [Sulfolobaceae archaeon RB850M]|jgi:hypothetical protein
MAVMVTALAYFFTIAVELIHKKLEKPLYSCIFLPNFVVLNEKFMGSAFGIAQFANNPFSALFGLHFITP